MLGSIRSRLTYANVVSTACLFIVLGGTSYAVATGSIDSREIKNSTIRTKDIRNNDVRGRDIRTGTVRGSDVGNNSLTGADILESSLARVPSANSATTATIAASAATATTAGTAEPRAFARVEDDGGVVATQAKNLASTNVSHPGLGLYCFDVPFLPRSALATTYSASDDADNIVSVALPFESGLLPDCAPGNEVEVRIFDNGGAAEDGEFFMQLN